MDTHSTGQRKRLIGGVLRLLVTAVGIAFIITQIDFAALWRGLLSARWQLVGLALLMFQAGIVIRALRWQVLLRALGTHVGLVRLIELYYAGAFFNTFLPTGFGGDVVRVIESSQDADASSAIVAVGLDRASGLYVLFAIALLTLPSQLSVLPVSLIALVAGTCVAGIAGWILFLHTNAAVMVLAWVAQRVRLVDLSAVVRLAEAIRNVDRGAVRKAVAASVGFDILLIATHYVLSLAFGLGLGIRPFAVFTPLGSLLLLLPSIQGWGVREPTYVLLLGSVGVGPELAVAFSIGVYLLSLSTGLVGAIYYGIGALVSAIGKRPAGTTSRDGSGLDRHHED